MERLKIATVWLGGCSGCHMSFLDQDERLVDLAQKIQLVYSPIVDIKEFPENVAVTLIEGAIANQEHALRVGLTVVAKQVEARPPQRGRRGGRGGGRF